MFTLMGAVAVFGLLFFSPMACAHKDWIFPLGSNGKVEGIPEKFGEVSIEVSAKTVRVQIGRKMLDLPPCISKLFQQSSPQKMRVLGSWYHSRSTLPPYLNIELPEASTKEKEYWSGHTLLINLETAEIIKIQKVIGDGEKKSRVFQTLALSELCSEPERKKLSPILR